MKFRFQKIKWHEFISIVYNFDEIWSSNRRVYTVKKDNFFPLNGKNRHITPNILEYRGPIIINFTGLVGIWVEMITRYSYGGRPRDVATATS